jgi:hypothetical protein
MRVAKMIARLPTTGSPSPNEGSRGDPGVRFARPACPFRLIDRAVRMTGCVRSSSALSLWLRRTPCGDQRVPWGVSDTRRRKTETKRTDRPTGDFNVAGTPRRPEVSYAAWRV